MRDDSLSDKIIEAIGVIIQVAFVIIIVGFQLRTCFSYAETKFQTDSSECFIEDGTNVYHVWDDCDAIQYETTRSSVGEAKADGYELCELCEEILDSYGP